MKILDRLPIPQTDRVVSVGTDYVRLKKDQIIVWISLTADDVVRWKPTAQVMPAILDTGHTHHFAIQNQHVVLWAGMQPDRMHALGNIRHGNEKIPLYALRVWLHGNRRNEMALAGNEPRFLDMPEGIAVFPAAARYPRLPLLGLRALVGNQLYLTVNGQRESVTLRTPDWKTRLLSWMEWI
jgi:hypothetical protein